MQADELTDELVLELLQSCSGADSKEEGPEAPEGTLQSFGLDERIAGVSGGAVVFHRPCAVLGSEADALLAALRPGGAAEIRWERRKVLMWGAPRTQGRDTAFFGDEGTEYRYSGTANIPEPWSADASGALVKLRDIARSVGGWPFNFCLLNFYGSGRDYISPHSDDERDLVPGSPIFSISLGAARSFVLEPKNGGPAHTLQLAHGSALMMAENTQRAYKHSVPKEKHAGARVNLTFRCVKA